MPTNRSPLRRDQNRRWRITPDMVALFSEAEAVQQSGAHEKWEDEGGRRGRWHELRKGLWRALGLSLHETSPLDVETSAKFGQSLHQLDDDERRAVALRRLMLWAAKLDPERRDVFLQHINALLLRDDVRKVADHLSNHSTPMASPSSP
jgi:hypothetical protein